MKEIISVCKHIKGDKFSFEKFGVGNRQEWFGSNVTLKGNQMVAFDCE